jgi:serine/threonine protein kinase
MPIWPPRNARWALRVGMPVTALREVRILQSSRHPNIVNLLRVVTGRALHSLTSHLNLRTFGTHRSRQSST